MTTTEIPKYLDLDTEVSGGYTPIPLGRYSAKVINVDVQESKYGKAPSLDITFSITRGDYEGEDVHAYRNLTVYPPKPESKQKTYFAPGLQEIKTDLRSIDQLPVGTKVSTDAAETRQMYAKAFARKEVDILIREETYKDKTTGETKKTRKVQVVGLTGGTTGESEDLGLA